MIRPEALCLALVFAVRLKNLRINSKAAYKQNHILHDRLRCMHAAI